MVNQKMMMNTRPIELARFGGFGWFLGLLCVGDAKG